MKFMISTAHINDVISQHSSYFGILLVCCRDPGNAKSMETEESTERS